MSRKVYHNLLCRDGIHEYLLAFSCKRRHFCPSCHQKRVVEFGEWLCQNVIKAVPHRHFVFSIPKILRRYFLYDRSLLLELSRCIWETLKIYYPSCLPGKNSVPGAVIALQTFGDFLGFNPHGHVLITDGCFPEKGLFVVAPTVKLKYLEKIFRSKVLTILLAKGKITPDLINLLKSWRHSGFQVFCGPRIHPREKASMENLARYIIRASFSQERLTYLPEESRILYRSKDNRQEKVFDALEWLAAMTSHIPDQGQQMVRYYGFYSNVSRGLRQKEKADGLIPCVLEAEENAKPNRNWARLIQKIYEVDPLTCPKCQGPMRIISIIEDQEVIDKIFRHLGLWQTKQRPPPKPKTLEFQIDYSDSQLTFYEDAPDQDFEVSADHPTV